MSAAPLSSPAAPRPVIVAHLFPELLAGLLDLLRSLPMADWDHPTACAGWTVKDVALHLLGGEIGNLSRRRDGHRVLSSAAGWDEVVAYVNGWNQDWVQAARRMSTRLVCDLLEFTGPQMADYFRSLDPYEIGGSVGWAGAQPAPVWLDVAREYTERWHHQQHIRDALGRPGYKQPRYLAPVLAAFAWALPRALAAARAEEGASAVFTVSGPAGGRWAVLHEQGAWRLYEGATDRPDAEVAIDEDAAWRVFTHGLAPAGANAVITGDPALGHALLEAVAIIA